MKNVLEIVEVIGVTSNEEREKLAKLMSDGWSYRGCPEQSGEVISSVHLTDVVTGKEHKIQVIDGKLTMTEVSE